MAIRQLQTTPYESKGYTDENSLATLMLSQPDYISRKLTTLFSENGAKGFSFLSMLEGNNLIKSQEGNAEQLNNVEYVWDCKEAMKYTSEVVRLSVGGAAPGIGHSSFKVVFRDNWIIPQYMLLAPDGRTSAYAHSYEETNDGYEYTLQLATTDPTAFCDLGNVLAGRFWIMTSPYVPESGSRGNRSNIMGTSKFTNQISFKRYSKVIEGNLANKVVPIQFDGEDTTDGKPTSLWINEEMRQFEMWMREMNNHDLYISEYNRDTTGQIFLKDYENGKPIPIGAGIRNQIESTGNHDVYGLNLSASKLKSTVGDIFWGESDNKNMEIIIHGGKGFLEDFHEAIMNDVSSKGFIFTANTFVGDGKDGYLKYGKYFNQYDTVDGHKIIAKSDTMFDTGLLGALDKANGNLHPITGYPMSSHTGIFMDYSSYGGERNVKLATMKGQSYIAGVVKGLAPIPASWGAVPTNSFSTDKDESRYETKQSRGIHIANANHCFMLSAQK